MAFSSRNKGRHKSSSKTGSSPLDSRQRELDEERNEVQRRIDALQREIEEKRVAPQRPRQPTAVPPRRTGPPVHRHSAVLADSRFDDEEAVPRRNKPRTRLRREIRQAQLQMVALLIVLLALIAWAIHWLVA